MRPPIGRSPVRRAAGALVLVGVACPGRGAVTPATSAPAAAAATEAERAALFAFEARVEEYVRLHRKLESELPKLPAEATPEQIDTNQRALAAAIQAARPEARTGEFFTPEVQRYLRRLLVALTAGTDGKNLRGSIMDENPGVPRLAVNERYPDTVPLSTMPPELLSRLPALEEDLEYRFVGRRLVLLDTHAHIIVDFTDELLPG